MNDNSNFSLPLSPMSTRTLLSHQFSASTPSLPQLGLLSSVGYDRNSSPVVASNVSDGNGLFSELPSYQFSSSSIYNSKLNNETSNGDVDGGSGYGTGYLEDLLQEAQEQGGGNGEDLKMMQSNSGGGGGGEDHSLEGFEVQWNDSNCSFSLFSGQFSFLYSWMLSYSIIDIISIVNYASIES